MWVSIYLNQGFCLLACSSASPPAAGVQCTEGGDRETRRGWCSAGSNQKKNSSRDKSRDSQTEEAHMIHQALFRYTTARLSRTLKGFSTAKVIQPWCEYNPVCGKHELWGMRKNSQQILTFTIFPLISGSSPILRLSSIRISQDCPAANWRKNTSKTFLHCYVAYNASFFKKYGTETLHHNGSLEAIMHQWECIRSNQKVFSIHWKWIWTDTVKTKSFCGNLAFIFKIIWWIYLK